MTPADLPDALLALPPGELAQHLRRGHPIDPAALEGGAYRGISLGLPRWIERLSWKTFQKTFYRDPATGSLRGWNVRVEQRGLTAASAPLLRAGVPWAFGHYEVTTPEGYRPPAGFDRGLLIDYGRGANPWFDPTRRVRDPLVALAPDRVDWLLGMSYVDLFGVTLSTPSYFVLQREGPITYVP